MNNVLAAFIFFTRLPFWRLREVPAECFKTVVNYWPLVGWLTGAVMALTYWGSSFICPQPFPLLLAIVSRVLLTGALHEDGLADFFDGFGGGRHKAQTLAIMKDSFIGSYGVIGLILYFLSFYLMLTLLPSAFIPVVMVAADAWSKFSAAQLINRLPYARKEEESKAKVIYNRMSVGAFLRAMLFGSLPLLFLPSFYAVAALAPLLMFWGLSSLMKRRLQGYTGDCCGATFLLCEWSFYFALITLIHIYNTYCL
ncbi:MAG: adenosylcobinamide-GDP ribazoletransferase [Bacteroidia bacterium]|nr:adenosylcobinamide-GDP ribazoletransferase [Bacteroidia bacterium]